ncbi:hypothetical protein SARC_16362, partial [Sphaeroforma arctica JP610]
QQVTLEISHLFGLIRTDELSSCQWESKQKLVKAPRLTVVLERCENLTQLVCKEILSCDSLPVRLGMISFWLNVTTNLLQMGNLPAGMATFAALKSPAVSRLRQTWR